MTFKFNLISSAIIATVAPFSSLIFANTTDTKEDTTERILIVGHSYHDLTLDVTQPQTTSPDVASWVESVPGASINRNGPLTGIVQYRGLFGDRVAAKVNGQHIVGSGPNAMDAPLSYSPNIMTESVSVYRGIAPVNAAIESMGGAVKVNLKQAQFAQQNNMTFDGKLRSSYQVGNKAKNIAGVINTSNDQFAALSYAESYMGEHQKSASGLRIFPTDFNKRQAGLDLRWKSSSEQGNSNNIGFNYHYTDTQDTGTPSLPMDINFIYGNRAGLSGEYSSELGKIDWRVGYMKSRHGMDNFSKRLNETPARYRRNNAASNSVDFSVIWDYENWLVGAQGYSADHNSIISNPNNPMFNIHNFNNVKDRRMSVFSQWQQDFDLHTLQLGINVKSIYADADKVNHHMAMMNPTVKLLVSEMNAKDRQHSDTNLDLTAHWFYQATTQWQLSAAVARKQRAASYQERYLWLPMEATGGLADGNTYLGDVDLAPETALQANLGATYQAENITVLVDTHYQQIDDYIQGIKSQNMPVKMFAKMMMGSDNLLQYANVDAEIYGVDSQVNAVLSAQWSVDASLSYVRGKRTDIADNLYRIAPLNASVSVNFEQNEWQVTAKLKAINKQDKVANTNLEKASSGYGVVDMFAHYQLSAQAGLSLTITNLLDRDYQDHLSGYNRVMHTDTPVMSRLPSVERMAQVSFNYQF